MPFLGQSGNRVYALYFITHAVAFLLGRATTGFRCVHSNITSMPSKTLGAGFGEQPTQLDGGGDAAPTNNKFEELSVAAYNRSIGGVATIGSNSIGNTQSPEPRRVYNISDFPSEYHTTGGLDDTDRALLGDIYSTANSSFEYGLGESTYIAAWTRMPRWSGVDSDSNWVVGVRDKPIIPSHFQFNFGDIGQTQAYGWPKGFRLGFEPQRQDSHLIMGKMAYRYIVAPLVLERDSFDVYLVDGRWRVACACMSFLHAMSRGGDMEKVRVMVHDYDVVTRGYDNIEKEIAVLERRSNKLAIFKLKPGIGEGAVADLYLRHVDNPQRR